MVWTLCSTTSGSQNTFIRTLTVITLSMRSKWFERGAKEAINFQVLKLSLNRDGGSYNVLPSVRNDIIRKRLMESGAGTATSRVSEGGGVEEQVCRFLT